MGLNSEEENDRYWFERTLALLARREHSSVELLTKLVQKGCEQTLAKKIIDECIDKDYLNLERFAEVFARNQAHLGYGPKKTKYLLTQHEIPSETISFVLTQMDFTEAKRIALRKIGDKVPEKIRDALYRRGF